MKPYRLCWLAALAVIALVVVAFILRGWQHGGLPLLQLPGLC